MRLMANIDAIVIAKTPNSAPMPGTPTLFYGEEIGMGENLDVDGRLAVRTPMQWDSSPGAGFTSAPPDAACRPFPDGDYAPSEVNVEAQRTDPESLLNWFERLIRLRKRTPEIGWGDVDVLDTGASEVLALRFDWEGRSVVTMHNLSSTRSTATIDVDDHDLLRDIIATSKPIEVKDGAATVKLAGYGYRWFRLGSHTTSD